MHRLAITLMLMLAAVPWMGLAEEESHAQQEEHVLVLDSTNFHDTVKQHPFIVVEFYAPWCGHCKQLAPEYEKAAAILKANDPPIILAKVDANTESNERLAGEYGVHGYPTLKILENQGLTVRDYEGPRDADGIVSYLKKQVGPPSSEIRTGGKVPEFLKSELVPEKNDEPAIIVVVVIPCDGNQIKEVLISFNQSNEDTTEQSNITTEVKEETSSKDEL